MNYSNMPIGGNSYGGNDELAPDVRRRIEQVFHDEFHKMFQPEIKIWQFDKMKPVFLSPPATHGSFAIDVLSPHDMSLDAGQTVMIDTNAGFMTHSRYLAPVILPRSGKGSDGLVIANTIGLIDNDYAGPVKVVLLNRSSEPFAIREGDRIAQIMFVMCGRPKILQAFHNDYHHCDQQHDPFWGDEPKRGAGGFGSTDPKPQQQEENVTADANQPDQNPQVETVLQGETAD